MQGEGASTSIDERERFLQASRLVDAVVGSGSVVSREEAATPVEERGGGSFSLPSTARMAGLMRQEAARGTPFLFLPVLLAVGAAAYFALPEEPAGSAIIAVLFAKLCSLWLARSRPAASVIIAALLVFTMGMAAAKLETWRRSTPMLGSPIATTLTGQVRALEHMASGRMRLTLDVIATERPQLRYAPDRIRVSARQVPENLAPGDVIKGLMRLMPPSGPVRPGAYDFAFASYFQERGAVGFFLRDPEKLTLQAEPVLLRLQGVVQRLRRALSERILHHVQGQEGHIAVAMITGFRGGIPEETNEWLRRAGLAHILAISGLHMALAAGCVMIGLRWGFALFPQTASRLPVKKYAAAAALMLATLYLLISGGAVAAQRSYIMLAVMLVALLFDRAAITMRNLAIAALFITAASPHVVIGPSFQMSFAATAALIAAYSLWTGRPRRRGSSMPADHGVLRRALTSILIFFAGLCATSIIAGLATTLFGAWHFQRASPLALPANLAAMPLVSLVAMPSAVMAIITMPFGLDGLFWTLMGKAIQGIVIVAETIASHSPIDAIGLMPRNAFLLLAAGFTLLVIFTTGLRLLALPLLLAGAVLWTQRELPDVLVSDDARLVGVYMGEGRLAVNRERPNGFTMGDWEHALMIESVIKPLQDDDGAEATSARGYSCREGACAIQHPSGAWIVHLNEPVQVAQWCGKAAIIILDDATVEPRCGARTLVLTKRDLARRGAASIQMDARATNGANVTYAVDVPYRPWHEHRRYSRAARGLAPYRSD